MKDFVLLSILSVIVVSTLFMSGCLHEFDTETIEFYSGDVVVTIGNSNHVANSDFVLINFYANSTYVVTVNYSIGMMNRKPMSEVVEIVVPFTPFSWRFERDHLFGCTVDIREVSE